MEATPEPQIEIEMHSVKSSQIKEIGHCPVTNTLAVVFARGNGAIYHYPDVTAEQHAAFVGSESIGTHFGKHIKTLPFKKFMPAKKAA